ncbi:hypothetical protein MA16_Dca005705 [Dendrobium catenatum]|uniref:RNase H type-1 domain-containing protein n=1 Tax=Dendrobium catenatum TaxID=906689 RepID=A0A2I0WQD8_9ASPA|nr:hypothetical protein MA16_Dca005705 [Dendrobium catenatum]
MTHIFREGNACADWLAKLGCQCASFKEFEASNMPAFLRGLVKLDKLGLPYIRSG